MLDYITQSNKTEIPKIVVDFVDDGLTSVYQPPDVVINKPLKKAIRSEYEGLMAERCLCQETQFLCLVKNLLVL